MSDVRATIFDIQRLSVNDGPGIRTTVFFKGCPLRCPWCHNPESYIPQKQIFFNRKLCIMCGVCEQVCPQGAQKASGVREFDRDKCIGCGLCADNCFYGSLELCGREVTTRELLAELIKDKKFYDESGGGVTLSGGEVLIQYDFAFELIEGLKQHGIHVAIDTCGFYDTEKFIQICRKADLVLYDIKHMDDAAHKKIIGAGNSAILRNLTLLVENGIDVEVRYPMIKGYNDNEANIKHMAEFLIGLGIERLAVIPYHDIGINKFEQLGLVCPANIDKYTDAEEKEKLNMLRAAGLDITVL